MLALGAIILVVLANVAFRLAVHGAVGTVKAAGRAAVGKGSFGQNLELQFLGMAAFQIRTTLVQKSGEERPFDFFKIEGKGLIPTEYNRQIRFVTSVLDSTNEEKKPVWSMLENFQEPNTIAYQHQVDGGNLSPREGFIDWVQIGSVIPDILIPPRTGERNLTVVCRILDTKLKSSIELGLNSENDASILGTFIEKTKYTFTGKGYEESIEDRDKVSALTVRLAVAVAFSDGEIDDDEANTIMEWIQKISDPLEEPRRIALKKACNDAFRASYNESLNGVLSLSSVTKEINLLADDSMKYQVIELCFDVMAADGVAQPEEFKAIKRISSALELDFDELQKIKDQRLVSVKAATSSGESLDAVLGIDPSWSEEITKKHLRAEFAKWNGRLSVLTDNEERANTQQMLDLIAEARKRYE